MYQLIAMKKANCHCSSTLNLTDDDANETEIRTLSNVSSTKSS